MRLQMYIDGSQSKKKESFRECQPIPASIPKYAAATSPKSCIADQKHLIFGPRPSEVAQYRQTFLR
ncbi:hypothetical protein J6590_039746 [Homalodisca vitripennis]|nr:hypothetical protein J6590_039746 [Homalodisca vitripennis]